MMRNLEWEQFHYANEVNPYGDLPLSYERLRPEVLDIYQRLRNINDLSAQLQQPNIGVLKDIEGTISLHNVGNNIYGDTELAVFGFYLEGYDKYQVLSTGFASRSKFSGRAGAKTSLIFTRIITPSDLRHLETLTLLLEGTIKTR